MVDFRTYHSIGDYNLPQDPGESCTKYLAVGDSVVHQDFNSETFIINKQYALYSTAIGTEGNTIYQKYEDEDWKIRYTDNYQWGVGYISFDKTGTYYFRLESIINGETRTTENLEIVVAESSIGHLDEPEVEVSPTFARGEDVPVTIYPVPHAEKYVMRVRDYGDKNHSQFSHEGTFSDDTTPDSYSFPGYWFATSNVSNYYQIEVTVSSSVAYDTTVYAYFRADDIDMTTELAADKTSALTGENITFSYSALDADSISFQRKFDTSEDGWQSVGDLDRGEEGETFRTELNPGDYDYRLVARYGYETVYSDVIHITYTGVYDSANHLDYPTIHMNYQYGWGDDVTVTFEAVAGAESYWLGVRGDMYIFENTIEHEAGNAEYSITLPASLFQDELQSYGETSGSFTVRAYAIADGKKSSTCTADIHYGNNEEFMFVFPKDYSTVISDYSTEITLFSRTADEVILYSKYNNNDWVESHIEGDINMTFTVDGREAHSESYYFKARFGSIWRESEVASIRIYSPYDYSSPLSDLTIQVPENIARGELLVITVSGLTGTSDYPRVSCYTNYGDDMRGSYQVKRISEDVCTYTFDTSIWCSGEYTFHVIASNYGYSKEATTTFTLGDIGDSLVEVLPKKLRAQTGDSVYVTLNAPFADEYYYTIYQGDSLNKRIEGTGGITDWNYAYASTPCTVTVTLYARFGDEWASRSAQVEFFGKPSNLSSLQTLELPASLTIIESESFAGISAERIIIPDGTTSIGSRAFANCRNLVYINIPDSVSYIADDAFEGCGAVFFDCDGLSIGTEYANNHGFFLVNFKESFGEL